METKLNFTYNSNGDNTCEMIGIEPDRGSKLVKEYTLISNREEAGFLAPLKEMCNNGEIQTIEELLLVAQYAGFQQGRQALASNPELMLKMLMSQV